MSTIDVEYLLDQWGAWARSSGEGRLGYPSMTPWRRMLGSTVSTPQIDDATAMWVDGLISELAGEHPREAAALVFAHLCRLSSRRMAGQLGCSPRAALELVTRGRYWVGGRMSGQD